MTDGTTNAIAGAALALGLTQMMINMKNIYETDDVSSFTYPYVLLGISASTMWLVYQFRKGSNYSVVYSSVALLSQLYILQRLSSKEKVKAETKWRIRIFSSNDSFPTFLITWTISIHTIYVASCGFILIPTEIITVISTRVGVVHKHRKSDDNGDTRHDYTRNYGSHAYFMFLFIFFAFFIADNLIRENRRY